MLIAEIHGRYVPEALTSEDYVTSAVFGHLQYVPPGAFWQELLSAAVSVPIAGRESNAAALIADLTGKTLAQYDTLEIIFWPHHPDGEPDLLLLFRAAGMLPFAVFVEVKLDAGKSGLGEDDQLARYLRVTDSLDRLVPSPGPVAGSLLIFLTPATNPKELLDSLDVYGDSVSARRRLFRLDWQDVITAAESTVGSSDPLPRGVLRDVAEFLHGRRLEHFAGMSVHPDVPWFDDRDGRVFGSELLLSIPDVPDNVDDIRLNWESASSATPISTPGVPDGLELIRGDWT